MVNAIYDVDESIIECKTDIEEFQNSINDLYWDNLDKFISNIENVESELSNLYDLVSDGEKVVDDAGNWTKDGITALGLLAQQMESAQFKTKQYGEAIDRLNKDYADGKYSTDEYNEKLAELKENQWDSIKSYEDAKKAIIDLNKTRVEAVKDGMRKEIDAYSELIDKKKKELGLQKEAHDFQKSVVEKEEEIKRLEKKLAVMDGDNSASALAEKKKLQEELTKAREELDELYYEHSIEKQQEALDKQQEDFEKAKQDEMDALDESLKNEEEIIKGSYDTIAENTDLLVENLTEIANKYGVTLSNSVTQPWLDGSNAIGTYEEKLNTSMSSFTKMLEQIKQQMIELQKQADKTAQSIIDATHSSEKDTTNGVVDGKAPPKAQQKTVQKPKSPPSYGSTVTLKKSATNFTRDGGNGTRMQSWVPGSSFTVYQTDGSEVLIGRGGVYTGWVRLSDIQGYAEGTKSAPKNQIATIDELGEELQLIPDISGRLSYVKKGTGIVPADLTERLMEWGQLDPTRVLEHSKPTVSVPNIVNNEFHIDNSVGELIHIDNMTSDMLPDVRNIVERALADHDKKFNQSLRKFVR